MPKKGSKSRKKKANKDKTHGRQNISLPVPDRKVNSDLDYKRESIDILKMFSALTILFL